ncbi:MAG TPA: ABC transporter ATP-binding protein [Pseudolabrys sp.]|nr:ABC transporter ATP-binding protein [Pseudolabrys sp.]
MLKLEGIHAAYGPVRALENISIEVGKTQIVSLLGANGAGKTTTLNCISGLVAATKGRVTFDGEDVTDLPVDKIVARGIVQVPEGREIFPTMSVEDNLLLGAWLKKDAAQRARDFEWIYHLFPRLKERARQAAGTLSGGEQQMLMIGRALMAKPRMLLVDEPSLGLSPILVQQVFAIIRAIHESGIPILVVEQNVRIALDVSSYAYILENGEITLEGPSQDLRHNPQVHEAYLGR